MPNANRNRSSSKGNEKENRTGKKGAGYIKLKNNPRNVTDNASTRGDEANPKYSRTNVRKDEKSR